jgi:hypothetical protein
MTGGYADGSGPGEAAPDDTVSRLANAAKIQGSGAKAPSLANRALFRSYL